VGLELEPLFFTRINIEVYCRGKACGLARLVNLHLNSHLDGSQHYDR
jgi:ribonuclease D